MYNSVLCYCQLCVFQLTLGMFYESCRFIYYVTVKLIIGVKVQQTNDIMMCAFGNSVSVI